MSRYRIYRNLQRGEWTVQHKIKGKGWRKLDGHRALYVPQVEFKVYDSGRQRTRHEGRKNVHAFALTDEYWPVDAKAAGNIWDACRYVVSYSPWNDKGFTTMDGGGRNLASAAACIFTPWGSIGVDKCQEPLVWSQPKLEEALGVIRITVPNVTS